MRQSGLLASVRRFAAETPDRIALTFLDDESAAPRTLTFGQLDSESRRIARRMLRHCPDAQRALLLHRPGPEFVTALCACWVAGITPVPTYPPTYRLGSRASERFERLVADAGAQLALVDSASLGRVWQAGHGAGVLRWLATDDTDPGDAAGAESKEGAGPALIQYTSGSTGSPRGVCLSHANLEANLTTIAERFGVTPLCCAVSWLPPYHDMGLIGGILPMLAFGVHLVLMAPARFIARPQRWLEAISHYRAQYSGGPNFAYELCAQKLTAHDLAGLDLSSWRTAFCGAETVRAASLQRFAALAAGAGFSADALMPCYGLAEATLLVSARPPGAGLATHALGEAGAAAQARVSCGAPGAGVSVAIVDERGRRCAERTIGEIWIAGDQVAAGYWRQDQLNAQVFGQALACEPGAWLRSGDTGYLHDGQLYVTGRIKDLIILRGRNCYPADIEQLAGACHPALEPLAVAAFSDDGAHGERLVIACELRRERRRADQQQIARTIQAALAQALEVRADDIVLLLPGALPRTTSGKISRSGARAAWRAGELAVAPAAPPKARAAGQAALLDCAARLAGLDPGQLDIDWTLGELGIDSLKRVELAITLEQELGRTIGVEQLRPDLPLHELQRLLDEAPGLASNGGAAQALVYSPSPTQLEFLSAGVADLNDFLEIVYLRVPAALDLAALRAALDWQAQRHPALRLRFERGGEVGWSARPDGPGIGLSRLDMATAQAGARGWQEAVQQQLRAAIDVERGHLAHAVWLDRGAAETGVLALALHHLAIDAVSVAILLRGLLHAYGRACEGTLTAPPGPDAFLDWLGERQARAAAPGWAARELAFWRAVCGAAAPPAPQPWPLAIEHTTQQRLSPLANRRFLERFADGPARHDALLAAFCHAWCSVSGDASALVLLNQHGRSGANAAAVGWLVDFYPVRVDADPSSPQRQYAAARKAHAAVAPHAPDYALLRHGDAAHGAQAEQLARPALALEFRGAIDNGFRRDGALRFLGAAHLPGAWNEARARSGSFPLLALNAGLSDGALAWRLCYLPHALQRDQADAVGAAIERFMERLLEN